MEREVLHLDGPRVIHPSRQGCLPVPKLGCVLGSFEPCGGQALSRQRGFFSWQEPGLNPFSLGKGSKKMHVLLLGRGVRAVPLMLEPGSIKSPFAPLLGSHSPSVLFWLAHTCCWALCTLQSLSALCFLRFWGLIRTSLPGLGFISLAVVKNSSTLI